MSVISALSKLFDIESKSKAKQALIDVSQARSQEWRGVGFRVGSIELVTSMNSVVEVLDPMKCTQVPTSEQWFQGVANVRGQLVPISDFHAFLYGEASIVDRNTRTLVFKLANSVAGLVVSGVSGVRTFPEDSIDQKFPKADEHIKPFFAGCFHRAGDDFPVFDFNRLVANERFMNITAPKE